MYRKELREKGKILKGKSMTSEEIHLNAYMKKHSIEAIETDLGEKLKNNKQEKAVPSRTADIKLIVLLGVHESQKLYALIY